MLLAPTLSAEEGIWPLDQLPPTWRAALTAPASETIERIQAATIRLPGQCAGSLISPQGLLLTSQTCVRRCLAQLSSSRRNRLLDGFRSQSLADEAICPDGIGLQQLDARPISAAQATGTAGALLISECASARQHCEIVGTGDAWQLVRYLRYADIRLVFAPEASIAAYGGTAQFQQFPRYALDFALLRLYEEGQPLVATEYFPLQADRPRPNQRLFVPGFPAALQRDLPNAQLRALRDVVLPQQLGFLVEWRGRLDRYAASQEGAKADWLNADRFDLHQSISQRQGQWQTLREDDWLEQREHAKGAKPPTLSPWLQHYAEWMWLEQAQGLQSDYFLLARHLVRAAQQRQRPDAQRGLAYRERELPRLTQQLFAAPVPSRDRDRLRLAWSLEMLAAALGAEHPAVTAILGEASPATRATELVNGTQLDSLAYRRDLWAGGEAAIAASEDPMIKLARALEPLTQALPHPTANELGDIQTPAYPATDTTLRLTSGSLSGLTRHGHEIYPITSLAGAFARAGSNPADVLPDSWLRAELELDLATAMTIALRHDVAGGLPGSPVLDQNGALLGVVFDYTQAAAGSRYRHADSDHRSIAVHAAAILTALRDVYQQHELVTEIQP